MLAPAGPKSPAARSERLLRDRRLFYGVLSRHNIPVPRHVVVSRDGLLDAHTKFEEFDDHIIVDGERLNKPFVEKPVDAEVWWLRLRP